MMRALIPAVLIVIAFFVCSRLSPHFADAAYLLNSSTLYMEMGLISLGMTLVIISGNIDLSVGSILVLTACITAKLLDIGLSIPLAVVMALGIGTVLGMINGLVVAKLRIPSFLVTLGTMALYRGAAQAMLGPTSVKLPHNFVGLDMKSVGGLPYPLIIFLLAAIVIGLLLHQTVFGRWIFAVGTNESASLYSAIPVDRVKIIVFALTGFLCGIGALMIDSRLGVARHDLVPGIELDAITVAVVGGASIAGGKGTILGTVLALVLIDVLHTGMGVANVKAEYQLTVIGVLLVAAVLLMNGANAIAGMVRKPVG